MPLLSNINASIETKNVRMCVACKKKKPRANFIRITVDYKTNHIKLNDGHTNTLGRSCYLCRSQLCLTQAVKGTYIKLALQGRKAKSIGHRRIIKWPLEEQLIQVMFSRCTEL